jgi:hypothetical protein
MVERYVFKSMSKIILVQRAFYALIYALSKVAFLYHQNPFQIDFGERGGKKEQRPLHRRVRKKH